jgi:hypothetical protein
MKNGLGMPHFIIGLRIDFEVMHTRQMFDQALNDAHCLGRFLFFAFFQILSLIFHRFEKKEFEK